MAVLELCEQVRQLRQYNLTLEEAGHKRDLPRDPRFDMWHYEDVSAAEDIANKFAATRLVEKVESLLGEYGIRRIGFIEGAGGFLLEKFGITKAIKKYGASCIEGAKTIGIDTKVCDAKTAIYPNTDEDLTIYRSVPFQIMAYGSHDPHKAHTIDMIVPIINRRNERGFLRFDRRFNTLELWGCDILTRDTSWSDKIRTVTPTDVRQFREVILAVSEQLYIDKNEHHGNDGINGGLKVVSLFAFASVPLGKLE